MPPQGMPTAHAQTPPAVPCEVFQLVYSATGGASAVGSAPASATIEVPGEVNLEPGACPTLNHVCVHLGVVVSGPQLGAHADRSMLAPEPWSAYDNCRLLTSCSRRPAAALDAAEGAALAVEVCTVQQGNHIKAATVAAGDIAARQ
eukprot:COSAG01_NODE_9129_length_2543_cov_2.799100_1_plen_146_part_00